MTCENERAYLIDWASRRTSGQIHQEIEGVLGGMPCLWDGRQSTIGGLENLAQSYRITEAPPAPIIQAPVVLDEDKKGIDPKIIIIAVIAFILLLRS